MCINIFFFPFDNHHNEKNNLQFHFSLNKYLDKNENGENKVTVN